MILPPQTTDPRADEVLDVDYADVRVPMAYGILGDRPATRPVGRPCPGAGAGHPSYGRHLFDALIAEEGDVYGEDDELVPSRFRLALTCLRCGAVERLEGRLDVEEHRRRSTAVDPTPVRAGGLTAQQVSPGREWSLDAPLDTWTIYRDGIVDTAGQPRRVGVIGWARGPRGRAYYVGRIGAPRHHRGAGHADEPRAEAPTVTGVLRKLAQRLDDVDRYLATVDAELEAWRTTVREDQERRHAAYMAEQERQRAGLPRVVELRPDTDR